MASNDQHLSTASLVVIVALLDKRDHACQGAPMVELRAAAISVMVVCSAMRRVVLADVAVLAPLPEHEGIHLLAKRLPSLTHLRDVVVILQGPIRQLRHGTPHVAAPVAERWEGSI